MDYYQQLAETEQFQNQIKTLGRGFATIKEGHQKLYDYRDRLTAKELGTLLTGLASDIQDIIVEFRKISNK